MKKTTILTAVISVIFAGSAYAKNTVKYPAENKNQVQTQIKKEEQNKSNLIIFACDLENNHKITVSFNKNNKVYQYAIKDNNNNIKTFLVNEDEIEPPHYYHNGDTGALGITIISYNKDFDAFISGEVENRDIFVNISKLNFESKCKKDKIAYDFLQLYTD